MAQPEWNDASASRMAFGRKGRVPERCGRPACSRSPIWLQMQCCTLSGAKYLLTKATPQNVKMATTVLSRMYRKAADQQAAKLRGAQVAASAMVSANSSNQPQ